MAVSKKIEHSFLIPAATLTDIEQLCAEAREYKFAAVCVPPMFVKKAKALLTNSDINVATVIGFPFGYNAIESKLAEAILAIVDGADELDMVINMIALKSCDWQYLAKEINTILPVVRKSEKVIKVIIETGALTENEITACCDLYGAADVNFIQLATGFLSPPASLSSLKLVRKQLADRVRIKAVVNDSSLPASAWLEAGADRLVCTNPVQLLQPTAAAGMIFENSTAQHISHEK